jgi:HSP20 family molecular chaperone IbpA
MFEDEREIVIIAAMPGVTPDRVNVLHEPGVLVIRGERQLPCAGSRLAVRQLEIPYGVFERRIALPAVHLDAGVPELTQGLLVLRMRKTG